MQDSDFTLLPCTEEDLLAISLRDSFCFPPFYPLKDDDPVSLDTFFCKVIPDESRDHFVKTYKFVKKEAVSDILALASISNSSFSFGSYEMKPDYLRGCGYNEAFPSVLLNAFGVRRDCQRQGLGSLAFNMLIDMIRVSSVAGVRFMILHPLESAVEFYKSLGCIEIYDDTESVVEYMFLDIWRE